MNEEKIPVDPLFRRRTPESAAMQLSMVLVNLLECEMATLEGLEMKKSASAYDLKRHRSIVETYLNHVIDLDIPENTRGIRGMLCSRVRDAILARRTP